MRREINNFEFGWMNGKSNLTLNAAYGSNAYIIADNEYLYFDVEFNKDTLIYTITHSMRFEYPWCGMSNRLNCGTYKTFKGEKISNRESNLRKNIIDWFVGMYGSDELLLKYFGEDYLKYKDKYDEMYTEEWDKYFEITKNAMVKFKEDFCL